MLSLSLQRSPRNDRNLHPQSKSASRLFKSASVPKLTLEPPSPSPQLPPHNYLQASFVLRSGVKHHAFSPDVPYPLSYHRNILAWFVLQGSFTPPQLTRYHILVTLSITLPSDLYTSHPLLLILQIGVPQIAV